MATMKIMFTIGTVKNKTSMTTSIKSSKLNNHMVRKTKIDKSRVSTLLIFNVI